MVFMEDNSNVDDLKFMSLCQNNIIANEALLAGWAHGSIRINIKESFALKMVWRWTG